MQSTPFYESGTSEAKGLRRPVVLARRVLRRLLRPIFLQLNADLRAISERQDRLEQQVRTALALGWDHVALARRLASIEDQLNELSSRDAATDQDHPPEGEIRSSIRYLGPEDQRLDGRRHVTPPQSLVS